MYEDKVLKKLQKVETEMLKKLDEVCRRNGIQYFALFGTAIGAVRHKGFIPWDDDIDIGMLREDFEKLQNVGNDQWGDDYFICEPADGNPTHTLIKGRLYKRNTNFELAYHYYHDKYIGEFRKPIWIDIYCFDYVTDETEVKKNWRKIFYLKKLYHYAKTPTKIFERDSLKNKLLSCLRQTAYLLLNISKNPDLLIYKRYLRIVTKNKGTLLTTYETTPIKEAIALLSTYNDIFPVINLPFEDMEICMMKNYDTVLRRMYGNYMEIPTAEKRINHAPVILDFGEGNVINDNM